MRLPKYPADDLPVGDPDFRFPLSEVPMPDNWTTKGACCRTDLHGPELTAHVATFFPTMTSKVPPAIAELCAGCPVLEQCYAFSMRWHVVGIWAGRTDAMREKERRQRRKAARSLEGAA